MLMKRQGDLLLVSAEMPGNLTPMKEGHTILAYGEATGHHHKLVPFEINQKYLVSEVRPEGGYKAEYISGKELLERQPVDYVGGRTAPVLFQDPNGDIYFKLEVTTALVHQEHGTILLPPGTYRNVIQTEYVPQAAPRRVID